MYGIDWNGPSLQNCEEAATVEVPEINCPISMEGRSNIQTINPLEKSDTYGADIYLKVLQIAEEHLLDS